MSESVRTTPSSSTLSSRVPSPQANTNQGIRHDDDMLSTPSPIWKAYAHALRTSLTHDDGGLNQTGQAIYVTSPFQIDIPSGNYVDDAITNYHIYKKVDSIQSRDRPFYDVTGDSYFDRLSIYLRYCVNPQLSSRNQQEIENLRLEYSKAVTRCNAAYKEDLELFKDTLLAGAKVSFQKWMDKYGISYKEAWNDMENKRSEYEKTLHPTMGAIQQKLDAISLARSRIELQTGSNMPCAAVDLRTLEAIPENANPKPVDPKEIFYLARYTVNDLDVEVDNWLTSERQQVEDSRVFNLDLTETAAKSWASLGVPILDSLVPTPLPPEASKLHIRLKIAHMKAFNVFPGLWDVPNVRKILPDLTDTAPETIKKPFMKTTKILLAYDIEIEVRVKDGSDTSLASLLRSRDLSILGVQITEESIRNGVASIRGGNGRFPVLLAVLAAQC